ASAGAIGATSISPVLPAALTPILAPALAAALSAPAAPQLQQPAFFPVAQIVPANPVARPASNDDRAQPLESLTRAAERAAASPDDVGRLFDSAPAAPDLENLATVKTPAAPARWTPRSVLLNPAASLLNSWRLSRHEKRLNARMPEERVTTEEHGMQQTLNSAHEAIATGRLQDALGELTRFFKGREANGWYRANSAYQPYQNQGRAYIRFIERAVKLAYERAHARARDARLIGEARASARMGSLRGHEWRMTAIQERDSAHCAHHALFNAISASVGFVYPLSVHRFVERARELLNVRAENITGKTGSELAAVHRRLGYKLGVDVGEGMGTPSIKRWAQLLGMSFESRGPPRGDAQWSALLGRGQEVLISLRMFHERFPHAPEEREIHGHDYKVLNHEVYLLGAFDSPSRGARLYMVQDSGSGSTDFYTAEELTAVASEIQIVGSPKPVALP
ncbi:MAG: hypothetical protein ABL955_04350, partial [Elusimicrobiota bacterium]